MPIIPEVEKYYTADTQCELFSYLFSVFTLIRKLKLVLLWASVYGMHQLESTCMVHNRRYSINNDYDTSMKKHSELILVLPLLTQRLEDVYTTDTQAVFTCELEDGSEARVDMGGMTVDFAGDVYTLDRVDKGEEKGLELRNC